eukprot:GILJ01007792.1.p2 GENE.GILJ01007792.1~~GILJ01007792.1.p2  ORF type:complete len:181 (+),score=17.81 GILJ01007792.1:125-667(+)
MDQSTWKTKNKSAKSMRFSAPLTNSISLSNCKMEWLQHLLLLKQSSSHILKSCYLWTASYPNLKAQSQQAVDVEAEVVAGVASEVAEEAVAVDSEAGVAVDLVAVEVGPVALAEEEEEEEVVGSDEEVDAVALVAGAEAIRCKCSTVYDSMLRSHSSTYLAARKHQKPFALCLSAQQFIV